MTIRFSSSIENLSDLNKSFASGIMRVCYVNANRNGTYISKGAIEKAVPSMYNCPVVCNYDVESDSIGGHDIDIVRNDDGETRLVNLTDAIGVIPESARYWWETVKEDDGSEHEYFVTEIILWKRSPAFQKIQEDGITSQSMEISVNDGSMQDDLFSINDFTFTAFCLLGEGIEPCFESASLQLFSNSNVHEQFSNMMQELKDEISLAQNISDVDVFKKNNPEGGETLLKNKLAIMAEYGLKSEQIDFNLEEFTEDELREKFQAIVKETRKKDFDLECQFREVLIEALESEKVTYEWGDMPRYWFIDYDNERLEVYAHDTEDWNMYGFPFAKDGDAVSIDFACKKRKKYSIIDFDEGMNTGRFEKLFSSINESVSGKIESITNAWNVKYQALDKELSAANEELTSLRAYKKDSDAANEKEARMDVLAQFEDLADIDAFKSVAESCMDYSVEDLEEKCFAIRGRNGMKFTAKETKAPKIPVERKDKDSEPYGGIFAEFGINKN